jgi:CRISPR-associated endonuclease Csy4
MAMTHYIDIRLRPDPDFSPELLLSALYSKLHRALARRAKGDIGVSFPDYRGRRLGSLLRLHGDSSALVHLMAENWLVGMTDHVVLGDVMLVPEATMHITVSRVQAKSSPERLRRRWVQRHATSEDEAVTAIPDSAAEKLDLPYVELSSASTRQRFPLFIRHGTKRAESATGRFSAYGLSSEATVPWF